MCCQTIIFYDLWVVIEVQCLQINAAFLFDLYITNGITHAMHIFRLAIQPTDETDVGCGSGIECWGDTLGLIITGVVVLLLIPVTIIIGFCVFRQRRKKSAKLG